MITVPKLIENLQRYIGIQINEMASTNPLIGFMKPLILRAANNSISKAHTSLSLLADKEGNIDVENILTEMVDNLMSTQPFTINTSFIGDIIIGNGNIKVGIPYTEKSIVFNSTDLQKLKEMLTINV